MAATPTSVRIPEPIVSTIRAQARTERRSFSNQLIVLLEKALAEPESPHETDQDEVERLADLARDILAERAA